MTNRRKCGEAKFNGKYYFECVSISGANMPCFPSDKTQNTPSLTANSVNLNALGNGGASVTVENPIKLPKGVASSTGSGGIDADQFNPEFCTGGENEKTDSYFQTFKEY